MVDVLALGPVESGVVVEGRDDVAPVGLGEQGSGVGAVAFGEDGVGVDGDGDVGVGACGGAVADGDFAVADVLAGA